MKKILSDRSDSESGQKDSEDGDRNRGPGESRDFFEGGDGKGEKGIRFSLTEPTERERVDTNKILHQAHESRKLSSSLRAALKSMMHKAMATIIDPSGVFSSASSAQGAASHALFSGYCPSPAPGSENKARVANKSQGRFQTISSAVQTVLGDPSCNNYGRDVSTEVRKVLQANMASKHFSQSRPSRTEGLKSVNTLLRDKKDQELRLSDTFNFSYLKEKPPKELATLVNTPLINTSSSSSSLKFSSKSLSFPQNTGHSISLSTSASMGPVPFDHTPHPSYPDRLGLGLGFI